MVQIVVFCVLLRHFLVIFWQTFFKNALKSLFLYENLLKNIKINFNIQTVDNSNTHQTPSPVCHDFEKYVFPTSFPLNKLKS